MCVAPSTGAISLMAASDRVEPLVEAFIVASQLADLDGAAVVQHRAAAGQCRSGVQVTGPDQRVAAQRRVGDAGAQGGRRKSRVAAVLEPGAELQLPAGPGAEGGG